MTAHDQMRAMLDQLMGTGRNGMYYYYYYYFADTLFIMKKEII